LQRFRSNLDNCDPVLIDALASKRRVLAVERDAALAAGHPSPSVSMHRWFPAVVTEFPISGLKRPSSCKTWWAQVGSNHRLLACKAENGKE